MDFLVHDRARGDLEPNVVVTSAGESNFSFRADGATNLQFVKFLASKLLSSKISHRNNLRPSKDVIRQLRLGVLDSPADVTTLLGPSFPWDSAVNQSGANFAKFENSQKIEDKSYDDNFFTVVIRSTRSFLGAKKYLGLGSL